LKIYIIGQEILGNRNVGIYIVFILVKLKEDQQKVMRKILTEAMEGNRLEVK